MIIKKNETGTERQESRDRHTGLGTGTQTCPYPEIILPHSEIILPHSEMTFSHSETILPHSEMTLPHVETRLPQSELDIRCESKEKKSGKMR